MRALPALLLLPLLLLTATSQEAKAIGFDYDDFLVAGFGAGNIQVYDSDLTFKGLLDSNFPQVSALAIDGSGNLIAVGQNLQVRAYDSAGNKIPSLSFFDPNLGSPTSLVVAPDGTYYISSQVAGIGILHLEPNGDYLPPLGVNRGIGGLTMLPGGQLWGADSTFTKVYAYDSVSRAEVGVVGQWRADSLFYSSSTNTVLATEVAGESVFEVSLSGQLVRSFKMPGMVNPEGVVRGPNGDVYATPFGGIYHWKADGTFVGIAPISGVPGGIVWAGSFLIPEPSTYVLAAIGAVALVIARRRKQSDS